jgi:hypothetical protein
MKTPTPEPGYNNCFILHPNTGLSIDRNGVTGYTDIYPSTNGVIQYFNYGSNSYQEDTGLFLLTPADSYTYPAPGSFPQVNGNISIPGLKSCKVTIGVWVHPDYTPSLAFQGTFWYDNIPTTTFKKDVKPGDKTFVIDFGSSNPNANFFFNFSAVNTNKYGWELDYIRVDYNV